MLNHVAELGTQLLSLLIGHKLLIKYTPHYILIFITSPLHESELPDVMNFTSQNINKFEGHVPCTK